MTVTILKPGVLPETVSRDTTCNYCKCEFRFEPRDATLVPDQRDGDYFKLPCPCCKRDVTVQKRRSV